jgi:murein DD-endopeptidase MepM/ murein hydrolase activator NlpD/phage-related protein
MAGIVREMRTIFTASAGGLMSTMQNIQRGLQGVTRSTQRTTQQSNRSFDQMNESVSRVNDSVDALNDRRALDNLNRALRTSRDEFAQTSQRANDLEEDFRDLGESRAFNQINASLSRVQREMNKTGKVSQTRLNAMQRELERIDDTLDNLGDGAAFDEMRDAIRGTERQFQQLRQAAENLDFEQQFRQLPEHLRDFGREMNTSRREIRRLSQDGTRSLDEMADAAVRSSVAMNKITSVTKSGKAAIKTIQNLSGATKETQLAILGLNRDGTIKISTEETTERLARFKEELNESKRELEALRDAGDFGSYEAGMRVVEQKLQDVNKAMYAASRGGRAYTAMITELGVNTSDAANQAAIAMEAYRDRFIRSVDMMNAKSTQSKKMMDILPEVSHIQSIDRFFLSIGNRLEEVAKQGTAANLALKMLGPNASMKDIQDRIMLINQGLMRMQQLALGMGIAFAGFTAVMFGAAKGQSVEDNLKARADAMAEYAEAVDKRTVEILQTWAYFGEAEVEATKPKDIIKNFKDQVKTLEGFNDDLAVLAKRLPDTMVQELREMGPEVAGTIHNMRGMSDEQLQEVASLWKRRHAEAREAAMSELEQMRLGAEQKVKELEESLTPLSKSLAKSQEAWARAAQPFVETWGLVASKVIDATTSVANFINKLNEINPSISAAAGMFSYLFTGLTLILAPMAIGIGRANGMAAAFTYVFTMIRPFVLGLLRVAGMASVLSAAIIVVVGSFMKMWKASENLRNAVTNAWDGIKDSISQAIGYVMPALRLLGKEVMTAFNSMIGGKGDSAKSFWQNLGDIIAKVINVVVNFLLPQFTNGIQHMAGFLIGIAPKVGAMVQAVVGFVKTLVSVISNGNGVIGKIFQAVWAVVVFVVKSAWNNIKNIVTSGIAIITNLFQFFTNILQGNWKAAFMNLWNIVKNAVILIWNYLNLMLLGRFIGIFKSFFMAGLAAFKAGWSAISFNVQYWLLLIREFITKIYNGLINTTKSTFSAILSGIRTALSAVWNFIKSIFTSIANFFVTIFQRLYITFANGWAGIRATTMSVIQAIVNFIRSIFTAVANFFRTLWNDIRIIFYTALDAIKRTTSTVFTAIWNFLKTVWNGIRAFLNNILDGLVAYFKWSWNNLKTVTTTIFNWIKSFLSGIWNGIKSIITTLLSAIRTAITNAWNTIKNLTSNLGTSLKNTWTNIKNDVSKIAKLLFTNTISNFKDMYNNVKDWMGKIYDSVVDKFTAAKKKAVSIWNGFMGVTEDFVNKGIVKGVNWILGKLGADPLTKKGEKLLELPRYAKGTGGHPGGPAIVGDGGKSEYVHLPNGRGFLSPDSDTLIPNMPKGTIVVNGRKTAQMAREGLIPMYDKGVGLASKAKNIVSNAISGAKDKVVAGATKVKNGAVAAGNKVKDVAGDVWEWASEGAQKVVDNAFAKLGVSAPTAPGVFLDMGKGMFGKAKDGAVDFIQKQIDALGFGGGFDINFGSPFHKTSSYGMRNGKLHKGLDFAAPAGTPIPAQAAGTVIFSGFGQRNSGYGGYGNAIHIQGAGGLSYLYAHQQKNNVKKGDRVSKGQIIGTVGNTGDSRGNHVHFEIRKDGKAIDPESMGGSFAGGNFTGSGAEMARKAITQALNMEGKPMSWLNPMMTIAKKESGFNPNAINLWDSNARRGDPSIGLFQVIGETFRRHMRPGFGNQRNPLHSALAAIRYMDARYGGVFGHPGIKSMSKGGGYKPYAKGGKVHGNQTALVGEEGAEILDLPGGSEVFSHKESMQIMGTAAVNALREWLSGVVERLSDVSTSIASSLGTVNQIAQNAPLALQPSSSYNLPSATMGYSGVTSVAQGNENQRPIEVTVVHQMNARELSRETYRFDRENMERDDRMKKRGK